MKRYTLSEKPYDLPKRVEFALLDFNDPLTMGSFYGPTNYENLIKMLKQYKLSPILAKDDIVLFQSGVKPKTVLFKIFDEPIKETGAKPLFEYEGIRLVSASARMMDEKTIKVEMNWNATRSTDRDINLYFRLVDGSGEERQHHTSTICYRIFPTQAWKAGQSIADYRYLTIAPYLWNKIVAVKVGFYDQDGLRTLGDEVALKIGPIREETPK